MTKEEELNRDFQESKREEPEVYIDLTFILKWIISKVTKNEGK